MEPLRPVVTLHRTQNTITSLIAAPLDIRTHMVFALFSGVMYLGSALRGVRWELVPKAALPCALDGRTVGPHLCSRENLPQMVGSISPAICSYIWCLHHAAGPRISVQFFEVFRLRPAPKAALPCALIRMTTVHEHLQALAREVCGIFQIHMTSWRKHAPTNGKRGIPDHSIVSSSIVVSNIVLVQL